MAESGVQLGFLDLALLVSSLVASALIGLYFTNKNKSLDAFLMGDRQLSVIPVAMSLMTSCMSGLTLLGSSSELYYQGPSYAFVAIAMLLSGPITAYTVLPVYYRMNTLSLYKYLQKRYGTLIKYLVTTIFMLQMIFYNSVVLYLPSMALESMLNVSKFYSIFLIGLLCIVYSAFGGIKAVVWTDFFQATLMYAAVVTVGILGTYDAGGFGKVFANAAEGGRLNLDNFLDIDLTTRHTFFGIVVGSTLKHIYLMGVNQVQIQRALSLPTLKQGQSAFIFCSLFTAAISLLSTYMGYVVYSAYRSCDPYLNNELPRRDAIIIHYVAHRLSEIPGFRGIFVAGIFSATLSSLSSFSNSMAALALEDFVKPLMALAGYKDLSVTGNTRLTKFMTVVFGSICVLMAYLIDKANSRLLQATTTTFSAIGVPFLAAFALGIFTRRTNSTGLLVGLGVTLTMGLYICIYQIFFMSPLEPRMPVYYNEQCSLVFNQTIKSDQLPPLNEIFNAELQFLPLVKPPLSLANLSYMTLPCVQFTLTCIIAYTVSLLTGGWNQVVEDKYLVAMLHRKSPSSSGNSYVTDNDDCYIVGEKQTSRSYSPNEVAYK